MLYFDHNATMPLLPEARQAWLDATEKYMGNPSSPHRLGSRADAALQSAREQLAAILGCDAPDIVWTSGATESNNIVLHHFAHTLPAQAEIWISAIEHPCVLNAAAHYFGGRFRHMPVNRAGILDLAWFRQEIAKKRPGLVAVMAANNETGVLQPWREGLAICGEWNIPFFCDAAQWVGKLPARGLGDCDSVSGCAHKFGGPKGVGFLKCAGKGPFKALLLGGAQEAGRRAGTENVAGVLSMMAALEVRERLLAAGEQKPRLVWRQNFERALLEKLPGVQIVGAGTDRLWNTVSALMPEQDSSTSSRYRWVVKMDKFGYAVSTGSACASGKEQPSHVLAAMGYDAKETDRVLRLSSGWETAQADWDALLEGLLKVRSQMREIAQ
jgi:cysteine desulfurase